MMQGVINDGLLTMWEQMKYSYHLIWQIYFLWYATCLVLDFVLIIRFCTDGIIFIVHDSVIKWSWLAIAFKSYKESTKCTMIILLAQLLTLVHRIAYLSVIHPTRILLVKVSEKLWMPHHGIKPGTSHATDEHLITTRPPSCFEGQIGHILIFLTGMVSGIQNNDTK